MEVWLGTRNSNKCQEIRNILKGRGFNFKDLEASLGDIWYEEGESFRENARIKARSVREVLGDVNVLSEDSGLIIPVLNGEPGIYSARYGELLGGLSEGEVNELIVKRMEGLSGEDRRAYFKSVCVLILEGGEELIGEGEFHGQIWNEVKGGYGFGYDSIFYDNEREKTYGEMSFEEKNERSHRMGALKELMKKIMK